MKRFQARVGSGRFTRNTPENVLGMHFGVHERKRNGDWCGAFNPSTVGIERPTTCHACGESLLEPASSQEKP